MPADCFDDLSLPKEKRAFPDIVSPRFIDTINVLASYYDPDALEADKSLGKEYKRISGEGKDSYKGVFQVYTAYGVSAHYLIPRDGNIYETVDPENIAYHAGKSQMPDGRINVNKFSIGIALVYSKDESPTEEQYKACAALCQMLKTKYPIKNIVLHSEIATPAGRKSDPWNLDKDKLLKLIGPL